MNMLRRLLVVALILAFASTAAAMDFGGTKGVWVIGGYGGLGVGLGERFEEKTSDFGNFTITEQNKLGLDFGAKVYYGIGGRFLLGLAGDFQRIKYERKDSTTYPYEVEEISQTDTWIAVNANLLYMFPEMGRFTPCVEGGPGLYFDPNDRTGGFGGGVSLFYSANSTLVIEVGTRMHVVLSDKAVTYLQFRAGVAFGFGGFRP